MAGICPTCGLPEEVCVCEEIAKEQQDISIYTVRRRYGKVVTIVDGIDTADIDIDTLCKELKRACASGGTVKDGRIELQGDHTSRVTEKLADMGFSIQDK
jgi:translation initiation factor 1